jgi:2-furoyl-CoA dehydrogenase large subunit
MSLPSESGVRPATKPQRSKSSYLGQPIERIEDPTLLTGRGRYTDDMPVPRGTLHAAILRSPHAHAAIRGIDATRAEALPGVVRVLIPSRFLPS